MVSMIFPCFFLQKVGGRFEAIAMNCEGPCVFFVYTLGAEKPPPQKRSQKSPAQEKLDHKVLTQATVLESKWLAAYYIYL